MLDLCKGALSLRTADMLRRGHRNDPVGMLCLHLLDYLHVHVVLVVCHGRLVVIVVLLGPFSSLRYGSKVFFSVHTGFPP